MLGFVKFKPVQFIVSFVPFCLGLGLCCSVAVARSVGPGSQALAQVGEEVLTTRHLELDFLIDRYQLVNKGSSAPSATPNSTPNTNQGHVWEELNLQNRAVVDAALSKSLLDAMVVREADALGSATIRKEQIESMVADIEKTYRGFAQWKRLGITNDELQNAVLRHLRANEYLQLKTASMGIVIPDEMAQKYFEANRSRFGGLPFAQFKEAIQESLAQAQLEVKLKDWVEILKRKYKVRMLQTESSISEKPVSK